MRNYVLARNEYEECMEDEDWYGADYALTIVKSRFAEMEKHIAQGKPSGRTRRKMDREQPVQEDTTEILALTGIIELMVNACSVDGFGHVRDVHAGDMTDAVNKYKDLMTNKGNNQ